MTTQNVLNTLFDGPFLFRGRGFPAGVLVRDDLEAVDGFVPSHTSGGDTPPTGPFLTALGSSASVTSPLSEPRLHRQFADLRTDADYALFMQSWGWLQKPWLLRQLNVPRPSDGVYGEAIWTWKKEVAEVWANLQMLDMAARDSFNQLNRYIKWHPEMVSISYSVIEHDSKLELVPWAEWDRMREAGEIDVEGGARTITGKAPHIASAKLSPNVFARLRRGDLVEPLSQHLSKVIGEQLAGAVSPQVIPEKKFEWYMVPRDLGSVIWLQFMREFCGEHLLNRCQFCAKWIRAKRKSRRYCDDRCRQAGYRQRTSSGNKT